MWLRSRPLLQLACALGLGSTLGAELREWAALGLIALAPRPASRRTRWKPLIPLWLVALAALAALRAGWADARLAVEAPPLSNLGFSEASVATVGTWRAHGHRAGVFEPNDGRPAFSCEMRGPAPDDGAQVLLLDRGELRLPPRGPTAPRNPRLARAVQVLSPDSVVVLPDAGAPSTGRSFLARALADLRREARARCASLDRRVAARGLLSAALLGDRSHLEPGLRELFTRTGTRHLLAVSGLHVGLLAALFLGGCRTLSLLLGRRPNVQTSAKSRALLVLLLALYAGLVGGAPVERAVLAAIVFLAAPMASRFSQDESTRRGDALSAWALALVVELLRTPLALRELSVLLSYTATLAILVGAGKRPTLAVTAHGGVLAPSALREALAAATSRMANACRTSFAVSCIASLAVLPILGSYFGETSLWGIALTPWLVPLLAVLLGGAVLEILLPIVPLEAIVAAASEALLSSLSWVDRLPGTPWVLPPRPEALVLLLSLGMLVGYFICPQRHRIRRASTALTGLALLPWSFAPGGIELHALDVGHGTSVILRAPGIPALVFDAGSRERRDVAAAAVVPLLADWDVASIQVVLSHAHGDHQSALPELAARFPIDAWYGALPFGGGVDRQSAWRLESPVPHFELAPGDVLMLPTPLEGLELTLLRAHGGEGNEGSRSLLVRTPTERWLLTGDAVEDGLLGLLEDFELGPELDLLLLPHHGSASPWLGVLLDRTQPKRTWISAARPAPAERELARRELSLGATHRDGPLCLQRNP